MKQTLLLVLTIFSFLFAEARDTVNVKLPHFLAINTGFGSALPSIDFLSGEHGTPMYSTLSLKYGFSSYGNNWKDYAFGHPYMGIGVYMVNYYGRMEDIGRPISIYFFQGAQLFNFAPNSSINYEINLGGSFNWNPYDPFDNPDNNIIGSSSNIHFSANLYYNWKMAKKFDLNAGINFTHFSNGARQYPNNGMNMAGAFVEFAYHFNREKPFPPKKSPFKIPDAKKQREHEIMFLLSNRNATLDTLGTGLASKYTQRNFKVLGVSYSHLFSNSHRFKWGPSVEFSYDESAGVTSWREVNERDLKAYDRIKLGKFSERLSLGLSMKGEMVMPFYSFFANVGYDFIHANNEFKRLYQIIGFKIHLSENFFGTAALRATDFSRVQYLFINFGYTIKVKPKGSRQLPNSPPTSLQYSPRPRD
ncbi:hypothetical protein D0T49_12565 [Paludibacter sp. 221]|uniref:acyloxyacyl hydrolase n=1 Tax=Paludibacter sp. 221 TaxID=2302939 RepID=UPI0013CF672B|nr:acyloxyacyl hydrolase [Paludibacter sp. 221]NDV47880.1 hypothetical protein [Paludibacter sp. 221]